MEFSSTIAYNSGQQPAVCVAIFCDLCYNLSKFKNHINLLVFFIFIKTLLIRIYYEQLCTKQ